MRTISPADCSKGLHGLSRQTASGEILRLRYQKDLGLSNEQLHFTVFDHLHAVPYVVGRWSYFSNGSSKISE